MSRCQSGPLWAGWLPALGLCKETPLSQLYVGQDVFLSFSRILGSFVPGTSHSVNVPTLLEHQS